MRIEKINPRLEISVKFVYGSDWSISSLKTLLAELKLHNYLDGYNTEITYDVAHFCENCNREIDKLEEAKCTNCGKLGCIWCFLYELEEKWYCSDACIPLERRQDGIH